MPSPDGLAIAWPQVLLPALATPYVAEADLTVTAGEAWVWLAITLLIGLALGLVAGPLVGHMGWPPTRVGSPAITPASALARELTRDSSLRRLRELVQNNPDGIIQGRVDQHGLLQVVQANRAAQLMLGLEADALITGGWQAVVGRIAPHLRPQLEQTLEGLAAHCFPQTIQEWVVSATPQGPDRSVEVSYSLLGEHPDGRIDFQAVMHDVSHRKATEEALRESQARYQLLLDAVADVVSIATPDRKTQYVSPSYYRLTGWSPQAIAQTDFAQRIAPEDRSRVEAAHQANLQGQSTTVEWRCLRPDGSHLWLETIARPVREAGGAVTAIANYTREVHQRKLMELALAESRRFHEQLVNTMPAVLYIYRLADGQIVHANERLKDTLGWTLPQLKAQGGHTLEWLHHPDDLAGLRRRNARWRLASDEPPYLEGTCRIRHADGSWRWLLARETVFARDGQGRPEQIIGWSVDITEYKQTETRLLEAQSHIHQAEKMNALGRMAAGVAHEFNNALGAILTRAELLARTVADPDQYGRLGPPQVEGILAAARRATRRVAELQNFVRITDPRLPGLPTRAETVGEGPIAEPGANAQAPVVTVVTESLGLTEPYWNQQARQQGVAITVEVVPPADPSPLTVAVSAEALRDALVNLIMNATDAIFAAADVASSPQANPPGAIRYRGRIAVTTTATPHTVIVAISDNGIGMPAEVRRRCLEPFFTTKGTGHTGMGLATVWGLVSQCRGQVSIESPGEWTTGTTFRLTLPRGVCDQTPPADDVSAGGQGLSPAGDGSHQPDAQKPHAHLPDAQKPHAVVGSSWPTPGRGLSILVVDDEPLLTTAMAQLLGQMGHTCLMADGGQAALAILARQSVDLVITDLTMTDMDGRALTEAIKTANPRQLVWLITGHGAHIGQTGHPGGPDRHLTKPLNIADIEAALTTFIAGHNGRDDRPSAIA